MKIKNTILVFGAFLFSFGICAQYQQSTAGVQSTYSGGCPVSDCSGTFTDDGGAGGNYSTNIGYPATGGVYRVFCPDAPGKCLRITFSSFDVEGYNYTWGYGDYFTVGNGPAQNSPWFTSGPADVNGLLTGDLSSSVPFSYTANNTSGCLTLMFRSDNSVTEAGWEATLSCVNCGVTQTAGNSDCSAPTQICSNASLTDNSPGPGVNATDGCSGCVTGETYSNWYVFSPQTSGSLSMSINPNVGTDDLDFALYGPNVSCGSLGTPIRCSYAASTGSTGIGDAPTGPPTSDQSEDVNGDGWVTPINVTAGDVYYLMINNWTAGGAGYNLDFTGSTMVLDCTPLPIELLSFKGVPHEKYNTLFWTTASESNIDFYTIERSVDGENWRLVNKVSGSSTPDFEMSYSINDESYVPNKINYYRLSKTNFDGKTEQIRTISLMNEGKPAHIIKIVNTLGQEVDANYTGLRFIMYSDGTATKKIGK